MFDKKIKDVMTSPASCLGPHATVREAAQKMKDLDIGTVVCCDEEGAAVGIVTDRDIAVRCCAEGKDPNSCRVAEIMSRDIVTCSEESSIREAEELMESKQIRRLVVSGPDRRVRGVVALSDIAGVDSRMTGRIVEKVSQPASGFH
jgi:signal-transduction protein with cAMP-binding, CBS, and nucleotidyltransferase domain